MDWRSMQTMFESAMKQTTLIFKPDVRTASSNANSIVRLPQQKQIQQPQQSQQAQQHQQPAAATTLPTVITTVPSSPSSTSSNTTVLPISAHLEEIARK